MMASVKESWDDKEVRKARSKKDKVELDGIPYRSFYEALVENDIPVNEHKTQRKILKAKGELVIYCDGRYWYFRVISKG